MMPIKILIADDHKLFREGLVNLLAESKDIVIVGEAEDGRQVIQKTELLKPDIVLLDIAMPKLNGIEATAILKSKNPDLKIIVLSMYSDRQFVKQALEGGAMGYMCKNCTYEQLIHAINLVNSGKKYLSDDITEILINDYIDPVKSTLDANPELSERELEVLVFIAEGLSTKEISDKLFISVKTIGTHKQKILEKLELKTNADIIKYAIKNGLSSLE
jgi:DNA-binding NarL/FixJ family response regulator